MGVRGCVAHCCRALALVAVTAGVALAGEAGAPPLDPRQVEAGRKVYQEYCASCHGPRGEGQANWEAPNDQGELPAPPHNAEGHTWKHADAMLRSEEHTSELQSLMRISYAVFCLKKKNTKHTTHQHTVQRSIEPLS